MNMNDMIIFNAKSLIDQSGSLVIETKCFVSIMGNHPDELSLCTVELVKA